MKLILRQDVKELGLRGALITVADGYAQNYLIPRGLAVPATEGNLKQRTQRINVQQGRTERLLDTAQVLAGKLDGVSITVRAKAGDGGRLFGSITSQDIADGIEAVLGIGVDKRRIEPSEAIKALGTYRVPLRLHPGVSATIELKVETE
jgi:large subunit ribosomal protein L9